MEEKNKMPVLIFSTDYPPLPGGIANYCYYIAGHLSKQERVIVLAPWVRTAGRFDRRQGFKTIRVSNLWGFREICFFFYMAYAVRYLGIKYIFNAVWFPCGVLSYLLSRIFKVPYFMAAYASEMLDDTVSLKRRFKKSLSWFKIIIFKKAKKIFAISRFTREKLIEFNIPPEKIAVVSPGVDVERFRPNIDCGVLREQYNLKNKKVLLTVARLDEYKGHNMVISALGQVLERFPDTVYMIVGKGPDERKLKRLAMKSGLKENVVFTGYVPDKELAKFYNLGDIFVMPSREIPGRTDMIEGYGISYLEAGASGKPVIGGRSGGVEDAIIHGKTGLLVDPLNVKEITEAICRLLADEGLAGKLGSTGRKRTEEELNWPRIIGRLKSLLDE